MLGKPAQGLTIAQWKQMQRMDWAFPPLSSFNIVECQLCHNVIQLPIWFQISLKCFYLLVSHLLLSVCISPAKIYVPLFPFDFCLLKPLYKLLANHPLFINSLFIFLSFEEYTTSVFKYEAFRLLKFFSIYMYRKYSSTPILF